MEKNIEETTPDARDSFKLWAVEEILDTISEMLVEEARARQGNQDNNEDD